MNVKIGNYKILSTGTIIGIVGEPIIFEIEDLVFEMIFNDDKEKTQGVNISSVGNKKAVLEFVNYNNSLGTGNKTPIPLAQIKNEQLYLSYRVYALHDEAGKLIHYTFYLKEGGV